LKVELVRIGNSRGIRIPKPLIEQCGFGDTVELYMEQNRLVIAPQHPPRKGWRQSFAAAGASIDSDNDPLLLDDMPRNAFDREEWTW
jgi:antitoxin MazE